MLLDEAVTKRRGRVVRRSKWQLLSLCVGLAAVAGSAQVGTHRGRVAASTVSGGKRVEVVASVDTLGDEDPMRRQVWGCDDCGEQNESFARTTRVVGLDVRDEGSRLLVPLSGYADLGNPRAIKFRRYAKGLIFTIEGGDTTIGHGYEASFFIEAGAIVRRRVVSTVFPNDVWEETRWARPANLD